MPSPVEARTTVGELEILRALRAAGVQGLGATQLGRALGGRNQESLRKTASGLVDKGWAETPGEGLPVYRVTQAGLEALAWREPNPGEEIA
jgi:hypothetical protein